MTTSVPTRVVVIGAGGHGREAVSTVSACNRAGAGIELLGIVADDAEGVALERLGVSHLGPVGVARDLGAAYVLAIGASSTRRDLAGRLDAWGLQAFTLVHPDATVGLDVRMAAGVLLAPGARVTTNVDLGRHVHVNVNAVVSHDGVLEDFVTLSPGALVNGNVHLGEGAFLGTGAVVLPGRRVGAWATVGAGAVVTEDVPDGVTVVGVPARAV